MYTPRLVDPPECLVPASTGTKQSAVPETPAAGSAGFSEALQAKKSRTILTQDMGHQLFEKRHSRDAMTRKLTTLCERLDASPKTQGEYEPYSWREKRQYTAQLKRLWVFGSYSRGALHCGDLDVIVEGDAQQCKPDGQFDHRTAFESKFVKVAVGALPDVRVYTGTPDDNSSGEAIPEAKLVWDGPGSNWRGAISSIAADPSAGRHQRPIDQLPFRREQLDARMDFEHIVELREQGLLAFKFIPFEKGDLAPLSTAEIEAGPMPDFYDCMRRQGQKTRDLIPAIARCLHDERPIWTKGSIATPFEQMPNLAGAELRVGTPGIYWGDLQDMPFGVESYALVPHVSKRGPNGIWLISRGPAHPQMVAMREKTFWVATLGGSPAFISLHDSRQIGDWPLSTIIISTQNKQPDFWNPGLELTPVRGDFLFQLCAGATAAMVDDKPTMLRRHIHSFVGQYGPTPNAELFRTLGVEVEPHEKLSHREASAAEA